MLFQDIWKRSTSTFDSTRMQEGPPSWPLRIWVFAVFVFFFLAFCFPELPRYMDHLPFCIAKHGTIPKTCPLCDLVEIEEEKTYNVTRSFHASRFHGRANCITVTRWGKKLDSGLYFTWARGASCWINVLTDSSKARTLVWFLVEQQQLIYNSMVVGSQSLKNAKCICRRTSVLTTQIAYTFL